MAATATGHADRQEASCPSRLHRVVGHRLSLGDAGPAHPARRGTPARTGDLHRQRAFPLEPFNRQPTPKDILNPEIVTIAAHRPEWGWRLWSGRESQRTSRDAAQVEASLGSHPILAGARCARPCHVQARWRQRRVPGTPSAIEGPWPWHGVTPRSGASGRDQESSASALPVTGSWVHAPATKPGEAATDGMIRSLSTCTCCGRRLSSV